MVNVLEQGDNELVPVDYSDLLNKILQNLKNNNVFRLSEDRDRLQIDIDTVATQVAISQVQNPLVSSNGIRSATINFTPGCRESFPNRIREITECLKQRLESTIGENIEEFVASLISPLQSFQGTGSQLGFGFSFNRPSPTLQKQKLSLDTQPPGSASLLKFHKLTIAVQNISQFQNHLKQGLENYIDEKVENESDREKWNNILDSIVSDNTSDFHRLQRIVDTETLGKLKKEAKIRYLEYILENIDRTDNSRVYLADLIRRLKLIEDFINQDKPDNYYEVNYAGINVNYKDAVSRAEVLDALPIIPIVSGNLGESTDPNKGERQFIFGLKMKFGNPVQALGGNEVFDYHVNLLNPNSKQHAEELEKNPNSFPAKVLRIAFLYFFIFASRCNPEAENYNPNSELGYNAIEVFESKILPVLQGSDDDAKKELFVRIWEGFTKFNVKTKINILRELLKDFFNRKTILPTKTYPIQISVKKGILENIDSILNKQTFFTDALDRNPKECLRYITITEAQVDRDDVCQLPGSITIEDIRYFPSQEYQQFQMEYDIKGIEALPVMWVPESCIPVYQKHFMQNNKLVFFRYNNRRLDDNKNGFDSTQAFLYRFTISLLAYISLKILLDAAKSNLLVPMVRLHEGTHDNPAPSEKFMAHLSKALCHLLNEKHRCSSQGFRIHNLDSFKVRNGLNSLYSVLPKQFRFTDAVEYPTLEKLAIIIVSSLECDARTGSKYRHNRISNLLGEVVSVTRQQDGTIRVENIKTFSDNYRHQQLYRDPPILIDTVNNLYQEGYRHFLYIAQAPYTSSLNITQSEDGDRLYFMSPELIKELKGKRDDIKLYPVFFDKYYVRKQENIKKASAFYIQDTTQLLNLAADTSQKAVVFFNLFNGISVGKGDDRFYNGVISYSTLLNIFPGVLDDQDIRLGLINDDSTLKNDLLQYLTLFHFSRFEKTSDISLKLDPYQDILGEESFSNLSVFSHIRSDINFNSLAFLTEVKKVLNV